MCATGTTSPSIRWTCAAWLLPSFPLLLTGRLSARPMAFMFIPLAGLLCYFAIRRLPASWPAFRLAGPKAKATAEAGNAFIDAAVDGLVETFKNLQGSYQERR